MRLFGKAKSGWPKTGKCRRQPVTPPIFKTRNAFNSVLALPRDRTFAMFSWRCFLVRLSTEFSPQPFINRPLRFHIATPDLSKQPDRIRLHRRYVLRALVARCTEGAKILKLIFSTQAFVFDMADMQPDLPACFGVNLPRTLAAHLAGETVSVQHLRPQLRRYGLGKIDRRLFRGLFLQKIFVRLQIRPVIVRENRPMFILAQFAQPPGPLTDICPGGIAHLN